ncbi:Lipase class 3 [Macrophomina phaseolina MS6]|uniref:Lipase class 3 n=1 Tax=Macrophomina phaseolina (strain MS6) TaxID=1126212 RepID=K2QMK7_MACPH|nr:Lipase class 3 [Macrophomina phaseolina MS6]
MQPERQGFNERVNGVLRMPTKMASQSLSNINDSYRQKKLQASQSVTNLNDGLQRRHKMASQSVSNLHDRTNQYMAHTVALCDLVSSKLDQIITSIDDEVFSGNEQELVIYEHPPEHHQSSLDVSRGNNQNIAAVASYSNHFSKVWQYSNSRLPPHLPPLKVYMPTWPLLCLAAQYSEKVYHKPTGDESETHVEPDWRHGTKAMVIKSVPVDDMNTVVFAIRGSAGFMDWAVNFRPAPTSPKGFLDDEGNLVHSGFLYVARKMVAPVAARLQSLLADNPKRSTCSLLITGHSAGGAVAALLYAHMMSTTVKSDLNHLTRLFKRVHCVTFGAPPVSLLPIRKPDNPDKKYKKSLFFGFINEGDPVTRADKEVIKNMIKLYTTPAPGNCPITSVSSLALSSTSNLLSSSGKKQKRPQQSKSNSWSAPSAKPAPHWKVPPGILSCAGRLIILRDKPGSSQPPNPLGEVNVEACTIVDDELRSVVFGDPMCHMMKLYARRIEVLATRAVTAGGMDLDYR